jgi:hypothetical protein
MKRIFQIGLIFFLSNFILAQQRFVLKDGSEKYAVKMTVDSCEANKSSGRGIIELIDKKSDKSFQTLFSEDLFFYLNKDQMPSINIIQLYNEQSPLIFDDFNFDGNQDLAIRNGNNSSYGGPSYDVYVFNITKKQFLISDELTNLAIENLGMFQTDSKRKRIITFAKSGCCWHITTEYAVIPKKGLIKVYEFEEDATGGDEKVKVVTRNLIKNKWKSSTKIYRIKDYYKE